MQDKETCNHQYTTEGISYDNEYYVKYVQCPKCEDIKEIARKEDTSYR